jgi:protein required for attachment to host cells
MGLLIRHKEWVVACDGTKAIMLENTGSLTEPHLKTRETYEQVAPRTRELGTDEPGRAFSSVGYGRSAVEQTDLHEQLEQEFLQKLAARLDRAVDGGEIETMILAAPARALGQLRQALSPRGRAAVRAELDKNLVRLPLTEIARHIVR